MKRLKLLRTRKFYDEILSYVLKMEFDLIQIDINGWLGWVIIV